MMAPQQGEIVYLCRNTLTEEALRVALGASTKTAPLPVLSYDCVQWSGRRVVVVPEHDRDRTIYSAAALLRQAGAIVSVSTVSGAWLLEAFTPVDELRALLLGEPRDRGAHKVLTASEMFAADIPDSQPILGPIYEADVGLLTAWRGTGKTLACLSIAVAVAAGVPLWGWECPEARRVLYVDGEMPFPMIRGHLSTVMRAVAASLHLSDEKVQEAGRNVGRNLRVVTPDVQPDGVLPSLATPLGRLRIDAALEDSALAILDNVACLVGGDAENDPEKWAPIREYQLSMRRRGIAGLLVHHSGKGGDQRGHSSKEDILDWSWRLERPAEHDPSDGARFLLKFMKLRRDIPGLQPLECRLIRGSIMGDKPPVWEAVPLGHAMDVLIRDLSEQGYSVREIERTLREHHGIHRSKSAIQRMLKG